MNPISDGSSPQQGPRPMQDIVPPSVQSATQSSTETNDATVQPEIVNDLPVRAQDASLSQTRTGADSPVTSKPASTQAPANQVTGQDKELDNVLKDVNRQVKAADNKPPKIGIFKRWESVIITVMALGIAAALCLAAISAFKNQ